MSEPGSHPTKALGSASLFKHTAVCDDLLRPEIETATSTSTYIYVVYTICKYIYIYTHTLVQVYLEAKEDCDLAQSSPAWSLGSVTKSSIFGADSIRSWLLGFYYLE